VEVVKVVAERLGNTSAVCRKHYIHPALIASYLDCSLIATLESLAPKRTARAGGLSAEETVLLRFLKRRGVARAAP